MANLQLADNLRKYRDSFHYTQKELARLINISRQAYSNYETGKRDPDLDLLIKLCDVYQITLDQLVLQPFSFGSRQTLRESVSPYQICRRKGTDDVIYLTEEEISLISEFRGTDREKQEFILYLLRH